MEELTAVHINVTTGDFRDFTAVDIDLRAVDFGDLTALQVDPSAPSADDPATCDEEVPTGNRADLAIAERDTPLEFYRWLRTSS
ncbi:MAG: hypothetical protein H0T78_11945, partial [Longispora sp.]|nr:hypothetical protein [Longispora sp. (in: high G+C Gram-positive bacteria)]